MKKGFQRSICLLLALGATATAPACAPRGEELPTVTVTQGLDILSLPASYTSQEAADVAARAADVTARLLRQFGGPVLNETQKQELRTELDERLLPILLRHSIHPSEANRLLSGMEEICARSEADGMELRLLLLQLYQNAFSILGSSRIGTVSYSAAMLWLELEIEHNTKRYEENPKYTWYLEDAQHFTEARDRLQEAVGEETFGEALEILIFFLSSLTERNSSVGGLTLTTEELLTVLRLQSVRFTEAAISPDAWSAMAALLSLTEFTGDGSLLSLELLALAKDGYPEAAAQAMPALLSLYCTAVNSLTAEELEIMMNGDEKSYAQVLSRVLLRCEPRLSQLATALETHCPSASAEEEKALKKLKLTASYQEFAAGLPAADYAALIHALQQTAESAEHADELRRIATAYLHSILPYLTFAAHHAAQKGA